MTFSRKYIFQRADKYEGVRPINIYLLRLLYILMFFVLGRETWTHILTHQGPWEPMDAVAWCVWTAFATLAGLGIIHPLKMLPIVPLEIFYNPVAHPRSIPTLRLQQQRRADSKGSALVCRCWISIVSRALVSGSGSVRQSI